MKLKPDDKEKNQKGLALLLVLWIITLLSVVCAEFSWTMRTETSIVKNYKEGEQAYYTAEAGINRAIVELMRSISSVRKIKIADEDTEETEETEQIFWEPGSGPYRFEFEGNICEVDIEDEGNKINVNSFLQKRNTIALKKLLTERIGLEGEERDIVADSLIDWVDKDTNVTGVNGAEDDYYKSLDPPYECRDGEIPVLDELLLVKGVNEEIYYGKAGNPEQKTELSSEELDQMLSGDLPEATTTVYEENDNETSGQNRLNIGLVNIFSFLSGSNTYPAKLDINTCSVNQLLLLQGMDVETAQEIINARKEQKFQALTDRLPQFANYEIWGKNITLSKAGGADGMSYFKIKSRGLSPDGLISRNITCEVMLRRNMFIIMSWKLMD